MKKEEIKQKLLSTKYFENNEYLDSYCELILINNDAKKEKGKTQIHHILPKCYFKLNNLEVDNSKENIVNLLYKDHILAHYYICLCCIYKPLLFRLSNAFFHLTNRKWKYKEFNPEENLDEYQNLYCNLIEGLSNDNIRIEKIKNYFKYNNHSIYYTEDVKEKISKNNLGKNKKGKKTICIETQQVFESEELAKIWAGGKCDIYSCLKNNNKHLHLTAGGYHWAYADDLKRQEELKEFVGKAPTTILIRPNKCRKVKCEETNIVYNSIKEASKITKIAEADIINCCKGREGNYKLHFKYLK